MSKALQERLFYLDRFYGRGGWHAPRMVAFAKKYQVMLDRLLKDGLIECDTDYDLYRITDAGIAALKSDSVASKP